MAKREQPYDGMLKIDVRLYALVNEPHRSGRRLLTSPILSVSGRSAPTSKFVPEAWLRAGLRLKYAKYHGPLMLSRRGTDLVVTSW